MFIADAHANHVWDLKRLLLVVIKREYLQATTFTDL